MAGPTLTARREVFRLREAFTISRGSRTEQAVVTVEVAAGAFKGWGECTPYPRYDETPEGVIAEIEALETQGLTRATLRERMHAGAARNAVDCALWDLEAKAAGIEAWRLAGLPKPGPCITAYTLSLADPDHMRRKAAENAFRPLLKIKLGGEGDMARLEAVREGAPKSKIIVDANEGWSAAEYAELAPALQRLGVAMVEQPLPAGKDDDLAEVERLVPVCADESCHDTSTLPALKGKYDMINIKLDKTGGLTEALSLRDAARAEGYQVMVGCMMGSSLAMAPAVLAAQGAEVVDLDGPLLLAEDRDPPLFYDAEGVHPSTPALWG